MKPRKPGRGNDSRGHSKTRGRFVGCLTHFLLGSLAWQSLKPVDRALFIEVAQRWNGFNNGSIGLGVIEAGRAMHVKATTAGLAFKKLISRGFLVMTRKSTFHQKKLTREYRVTALPVGPYDAPTSPPTNDFMRWRPLAEAKEPTVKAHSKKQKSLPIRDKHIADSGQQVGELEHCNVPTLSPNGTVADSHSADSGQPSISMGDTDGRAPPRRRAATARKRVPPRKKKGKRGR